MAEHLESRTTTRGGPTRPRSWARAWLLALVTTLVGMFAFVGVASAAPAVSILDQCANGQFGADQLCGWQNGNLNENNSHYREDDSVPFRAQLTGLTIGTSYDVYFAYDIRQGGEWAYDYLTSYDRTKADAAPCAGLAGCTNPPTSTFAIPADTLMASHNPVSPQDAGVMTAWGATITGVIYIGTPDLTQDAAERVVRVRFTANAGDVVFAWGGHIASQIDWGLGNSASAISGSPYHMRSGGLALEGGTPSVDRPTVP